MNVRTSRPEPHQPETWLQRAESDLALACHAVTADDVLPEDAVQNAGNLTQYATIYYPYLSQPAFAPN